MLAKRRHFVEFYFPSDTLPAKIYKIQSRNVQTLNIVSDAYGFKFFDRLFGESDGTPMISRRIDVSPMHYCGGHIVSIQNAINVMGESEIAKIMIEEKWDRAIICNDGEYRNFKHGDILVMPRRKDKKK